MKLLLVIGTAVFFAVLTHGTRSVAQTMDSAVQHSDAPAGYGLDASGYQLLTPSKYPGDGKVTNEEKIYFSVRQKWFSSQRAKQLDDTGTTALECAIKRDGTLGKMRLAQSSGKPSLDAAAVEAVKAAAPFKELTPDSKGSRVSLIFSYNLPSTNDRPACNTLHPKPYKQVSRGVIAPIARMHPDPE
jgi:TonB family protein